MLMFVKLLAKNAHTNDNYQNNTLRTLNDINDNNYASIFSEYFCTDTSGSSFQGKMIATSKAAKTTKFKHD